MSDADKATKYRTDIPSVGTDVPSVGQGEPPARPAGAGVPVTLLAPEQVRDFQARLNVLKGEFVDEPRRAVRQADDLVGEVLDELEQLFRDQRGELERGLDDERTSTEDLRVAFCRYRSFFDRLLSF